MRQASITRATAETRIALTLALDGRGETRIETGIGFLDHMLTLLAFHARFDLTAECAGDVHVDGHHTTEDMGIALGRALSQALGDKRGITRYGSFLLPMDEALVLCALDLSGRCELGWALDIPSPRVGDFDTELTREFMMALCREAGMTLHLRQLAGVNSHHIIEAAFKALGRALRQAVTPDAALDGQAASSKGTLV